MPSTHAGVLLLQAVKIFGPDVFRKWDGRKFHGAAVDNTLWDAIMQSLAEYSTADLQPFSDKLQQGLLKYKIRLAR